MRNNIKIFSILLSLLVIHTVYVSAQTIYTFDARGASNYEPEYDRQIFAATLQGIVNRYEPRLWINWRVGHRERCINGGWYTPATNFSLWTFNNGAYNDTTSGTDHDGSNSCIHLASGRVSSAYMPLAINAGTVCSFEAWMRVKNAGTIVYGRLFCDRQDGRYYLGTNGLWDKNPSGTYHHSISSSNTNWEFRGLYNFRTPPDITKYYMEFFSDTGAFESYIDEADVWYLIDNIDIYWRDKFRGQLNCLSEGREFLMWEKSANTTEDTTIACGADGDSSCLKIDRSSDVGIEWGRYQTTLTPSRQYTLKVRGKRTNTGLLFARIYYSENGTIYYLGETGEWSVSPAGGYHHTIQWRSETDWTQKSVSFTTPAHITDYYIYFWMEDGTEGGSGIGYIDNVELNYQGWLANYNFVALANTDELINAFRSDISSVIAWDGNVDATVNVATTAAGIAQAPVVLGGGDIHSRCIAAGIPTLLDLRGKFTGSGTIPDSTTPSTGSKKNDAYIWAKEQYLDTGLCDPTLLAYFEDAYARRANTGGPNQASPRDYAVKYKAFVFDLNPYISESCSDPTPRPPAGTDRDTFKKILHSANNRTGKSKVIRCLGFAPWYDKYDKNHDACCSICDDLEAQFVNLLSAYNCVKDAMDQVEAVNMTVHTFYPIRDRMAQNPVKPAPPLENKRYVCFLMGDYSPPFFAYEFLCTDWDNRRRGEIPFGWCVNPNNTLYLPDLIDYLYSSKANNEYFVPGPSGAGYFYPNTFDPANPTHPRNPLGGRDPSNYPSGISILRNWNADWYRKGNVRITGELWNYWGQDAITSVMELYNYMSGDGTFDNFGNSKNPRIYNNLPRLSTEGWYNQEIPAFVSEIESHAAGTLPTFTAKWLWVMSPNYVYETAKELEARHPNEYAFVDPNAFMALMRSKLGGSHQYKASFVADIIPQVMTAGQTYSNIKITVRNEGSDTWTPSGNFYRLGLHCSEHRPAPSELISTGYPTRVMVSRNVPQGECEVFNFNFTAPSAPGTYYLQYDMVREGVTWFETQHNLPFMKRIIVDGNMLSNPGFENGETAWNLSLGARQVITTTPYEGAKCLRVRYAGEQPGYFYQDVSAAPEFNDTYRLSCWVRSPNNNPITIDLLLWAFGTVNINSKKRVNINSSAWQKVETFFKVQTGNVSSMRAEVYFCTTGIDCDFDAFDLRPVSLDPSYLAPLTSVSPTPTASVVNTPTATKTATRTPTKTNTPTATFTSTATNTTLPTNTATDTPIQQKPTSTATTTSLPYILGDANCDTQITPGDALLTFQFYLLIAKPDSEVCDQESAADWDGNGNITPGDALCIFREYLRDPCNRD